MAVIKVKAVSIIGRMEELDHVTEVCGRSGIFHPDDALKFYNNAEGFAPLHDTDPYAAPLQKIAEALGIIGKEPQLLPEAACNQLRLSPEEVKRCVDNTVRKLGDLQDRRSALQKRIEAARHEAADMAHFVGQELDLDEIRECKFIKVRFGSLPKSSYAILQAQYANDPYITFFPCTDDGQRMWGVYMCPIEQVEKVDRTFKKLYFKRLRLKEITRTPEELVQALRAEAAQGEKELQALSREGEAFWQAEAESCNKAYSWLAQKSTWFSLRRYAARYKDSFLFTGWVPAEDERSFTVALDALETVEYSFESADSVLSLSPPVKLRNRVPARPFEFFTQMYGLPNYKEVDPTPLVAVVFTLLFGIMFGDVGQGLVLAGFGWFYMWKRRHLPIGKVLVPCGFSAAVFGVAFGSFFGYEHFLDPVFRAIGFAEKPIDVMNPQTTLMIIAASIGIGFVCICVAMLLNICSSLKRKQYARALVSQNGVAGLVFYAALVLGAVAQLMGVPVLTAPYILCLIVAPLLVLFFQEILGNLIEHRRAKPEKMGEYLVQSFFELFETLLSLLSNTVSFLRVGAFVLVHSGMMMMVMGLAGMFGPDGSIGNLLMVIFGNIFVGVLETLLVCIHVMRLNFYELFSRFYDGDGRAFTPVRVRGLQKT